MKEIKISPVATAAAVLIAIAAFARREEFIVSDAYRDGYTVNEYWGSPVALDQGVGTAASDILALLIVTVGVAILLTYLYLGVRRVYSGAASRVRGG